MSSNDHLPSPLQQGAAFHAHPTDTSSSLASAGKSSSDGPKHNRIASFMFCRASSSVSPAGAQPGSSGQKAAKAWASASYSSTTRNVMARFYRGGLQYRMPSETELLDRIRDLEEQNSQLQDKLDQIWSVLASDYEVEDDESGLIQIDPQRKPQ